MCVCERERDPRTWRQSRHSDGDFLLLLITSSGRAGLQAPDVLILQCIISVSTNYSDYNYSVNGNGGDGDCEDG